jgi:hypothetical protein
MENSIKIKLYLKENKRDKCETENMTLKEFMETMSCIGIDYNIVSKNNYKKYFEFDEDLEECRQAFKDYNTDKIICCKLEEHYTFDNAYCKYAMQDFIHEANKVLEKNYYKHVLLVSSKNK